MDFVLACFFGLLASATYANGVLVFPVGLLFFFLQARRLGGQRKSWPWLRIVIWSGCFVASLYVYLSHSQGSGVSAHGSLVQQLIFLVSFCGGGLENMHHRPVPYLSVVIGLGVVATVLLSLKTRYDRRNPYFFYSMLWLMFTAIVVANARVSMGLQLSLSSRYKIYCDLLLVFCYEYWLDRFRHRSPTGAVPAPSRWLQPVWIGAALLFCLGSDAAGAKFLSTRKQRAETAMRGYLAAPASASPMFLVEDALSPEERQQEDLARQELNDAVQQGLYTPPAPAHFGFF